MIQSERQVIEAVRSKNMHQEVALRLEAGEPISEVVSGMSDSTAEEIISQCRNTAMELDKQVRDYDSRVNSGCKGTWNPTYTGRRFWTESPRAKDVDIVDIAHCLARINRYNGHTADSYSVAQHCCLVANILPEDVALFGLLHDASECYLGDVITPVKRLIREFYEPLEQAVMEAIAERFEFDMSEKNAKIVKEADLCLLYTEIRDLCPLRVYNGDVTVAPMRERIVNYWSADKAEAAFLQCFLALTNNG